jgi:hypothetical protein
MKSFDKLAGFYLFPVLVACVYRLKQTRVSTEETSVGWPNLDFVQCGIKTVSNKINILYISWVIVERWRTETDLASGDCSSPYPVSLNPVI